jgi:hypothetical protein
MTDSTAAEYFPSSGYVSAWDTDGFSVVHGGSNHKNVNYNAWTYVAWLWKAGNATLGTGDFTQGTIASTCSRNVDAGFSIVSFVGSGSAGNVGHGLSKAPEMIITKNRDRAGYGWSVYHTGITVDWRIYLNSTGARIAGSTDYGGTTPSATLFYLGGGGVDTNYSGDEHISYCFHSVDGFSKVGSYSGNGSADGPFIYAGFQPKYILWKQSHESGENWRVIDDARSPYNQADKHLAPSNNYGESTESGLDFLSNGFKWRNADAHQNQNGKTYIYIAFAEYPFKYSNAR